jgi:alkanesulfonate monooxygenase SsuD/methylene tetrahydromethanopterin reductase-like flavin-dependent oxidoreductase (luciferase family)
VDGADRNPEFGVSIVPLADPPDHALRVARAAEEVGLDLVGIQDHPYQRRFLDAWTLISTLVPATERVRFFLSVANLPLRPPAMLAKAAASLDLISGGRVEMGLGAGAYWDAVVAMGETRKSPGEALEAVREAVEVMRLLWSEERSARYEGKFYSLRGARPGPRPAHEIDRLGGLRHSSISTTSAFGPTIPWETKNLNWFQTHLASLQRSIRN